MGRGLKGVLIANITPMDEMGKTVDYEGLSRLCKDFLDWGADGFVPCGSTGEGLLLTDAEREKVTETVVGTCQGRAAVIVGATAVTTEKTIEYCRRAEEQGADAVLVAPPPYIRPAPDELYEHYRAVGEAIRIPVVIYNNPKRSGVEVSTALLARLSEHENLQYVKDSAGNVGKIAEAIRLSHGRVKVLNGNDETPLEGMLLGAVGVISGPGNVICKYLVKTLHAVKDPATQTRAFEEYAPGQAFSDYLGTCRYVPTLKAAVRLMGLPAGGPRRPLLPLRPAEEAALKKFMETRGLL